MARRADTEHVEEIMRDFSRLTGLEPASGHPKRYLWTDAFAVCNYLELFFQTKDESYLDLGLRLVDQVHHTLGRHRDDDPRRGWISGLGEEEGEEHPAIKGLRIGKKLNERKPDEPPDERLEWDQDGQYYHYLTKWMHALNCVSQATKDPRYLGWAIELAQAAHRRFTYTSPFGGSKRMYWKMSIDLTYPLVTSMGQHDPLDGFITYSELLASAKRDFKESSLPDLSAEIADMAVICRGMGTNLATSDPLGTGGLLSDASRVAQLAVRGFECSDLLGIVASSALMGLEAFARSGTFGYPAEHRLAFREFGISIGLSGAENLQKLITENPDLLHEIKPVSEALRAYMPLREKIERFWTDSKNQEAGTWTEHREINMVMLATSLAPDGFLMIFGMCTS